MIDEEAELDRILQLADRSISPLREPNLSPELVGAVGCPTRQVHDEGMAPQEGSDGGTLPKGPPQCYGPMYIYQDSYQYTLDNAKVNSQTTM